MSETPSFERFDYRLRTNKHIERKLVFDILYGAAQKLDFSRHWYLGFGSMWFGDFMMAHRRLGIDDMISMERCEYALRASFNKPFAGIKVEAGDSDVIMAGFEQARWERPLVAWLDYDGYLNDDIVRDIEVFLARAAPNSTIAVTVNAVRGTYRPKVTSSIRSRNETSVGTVEKFLGGGSVSPRFEPKSNGTGNYSDLTETLFPEFLTEAISIFMEHKLLNAAREVSGQRLKFVPLYRIHHKDGADMVTVGGTIVNSAEESIWRECLARHPILADGAGGTAYCRLDLVPLTVKEKIILDECLPDSGDGSTFLKAATNLGVALSAGDMTKYWKFYRHFPVFVETTM